jgi:hypothetical protein
MFLNAEGCRTLSLSDLYDESSTSSVWLNRADRQTQGRHSSRSELRALLSLSSEGGTLGEASLDYFKTFADGGNSLQADGLNSTAATYNSQPNSRHSSCAGFKRTSQAACKTAQQQQYPHRRSAEPAAAAAAPGALRQHPSLAPQQQQARRSSHPQQPAAPAATQPRQQHQHEDQQRPTHKTRFSAPPEHRTSAVPALQLRPRSASAAKDASAPAAGLAPRTSHAVAAATAEGRKSCPAAAPAGGAAAAAAVMRASLPSQQELTERKLVKCLKKLQQDKQRCVSAESC